MPSDKESELDACRVLAFHLGEHDPHDPRQFDKREVILRNLCWRLSKLDQVDKLEAMASSWYNSIPIDLRQKFPKLNVSREEIEKAIEKSKKKRDVGIITVMDSELDAVLLALGKEKGSLEKEDSWSGPFRYWECVATQEDGVRLSVVVTLVGSPTNVPCAICVEHLLTVYSVDLLVLVGIAAGPPQKVRLGDVIFADSVYDYEHVRLEVRKIWRHLPFSYHKGSGRPKYVPNALMNELTSDRELYTQHFSRSRILHDQCVQRTKLERLPTLPGNYKPEFHHGTIASGEKLIADGSLGKMYERIDQQIRAGEQEGSGFSQAAVHNKVKWCIFRGISDYGDPTKDHPEKEKWQFEAALNAASAAVTFLQTVWKPAHTE